jgi:hypothetical protein
MLGDWRRGHRRDIDVLILPFGVVFVMLVLVLLQGNPAG